jgi:nitroreductase
MIDGSGMLEFLGRRRSIRKFTEQPIDKSMLRRLIEAAVTAPSSTNRQPWLFGVITSRELKKKVVELVRARTEEMKSIIQKSHHAEEFESYGDFFYEPLQAAAAIIIPQYRVYPDLIAELVESGGGNSDLFSTAEAMQAELCSTSAAIMTLLIQAHAEGLGACWMAGPMVARKEIHQLLKISPPWQMVGAISLGYPTECVEAPRRKPLEKVVRWYEERDP